MRYLVLLVALTVAWCLVADDDWGDSPMTIIGQIPWYSTTWSDPIYRMEDKERGTVCYITHSMHAISCVVLEQGGGAMTDEEAENVADAITAATLAHGRKIGVMDNFGQLTEQAQQVIRKRSIQPGEKKSPGNSYLDTATKNVYICDLDLEWQVVFNSNDLIRELERKHNVSVLHVFTQENE